MSDIKNWVFLILLINLILLPIMWVTQTKNSGQVLGASQTANQENLSSKPENSTVSNFGNWFQDNFLGSNKVSPSKGSLIDSSLNNSDLPLRKPTGQINSADGLKIALNQDQQNITAEGKIVVRNGFKNNLAVRGFSVGDKITLKCGDKVIIVTVDTTVLSSSGVIGVANPGIFTQLGVDPNIIKELQCAITKL